MILIADSGSTKTKWILKKSVNQFSEFETIGYNPFILSSEEITLSLNKSLISKLQDFKDKISQIYFYGAGCSSPEMQDKMKLILASFFVNAFKIEVMSDLWSCIHASCGRNAGICCILGTGSNACVYNGEKIIDQLPSLGFILGDEGSGNQIGKELIKAYFYKNMPDELLKAFKEKHNLEEHSFVKILYEHNRPNQYIASFSTFALDNLDHPFIQQLLADCFESFIKAQILKLQPDNHPYPLYFIGSIAAAYENILRTVVGKYNYEIKSIQKSPFPTLLDYYQ